MFNTILYHENFIIFKPRQTFSFVVIKYITVLSGKYPANFTRILDSAGCLNITGLWILVSGSGTSHILFGTYVFQPPCRHFVWEETRVPGENPRRSVECVPALEIEPIISKGQIKALALTTAPPKFIVKPVFHLTNLFARTSKK